MRKKKGIRRIVSLLCLVLVPVCAAAFTACGQEEVQPEENVNYEIALVTDDSLVMDGGHSEAIWNAITEFGVANGISHKYFKAVESTDAAYRDAILLAIEKGAKVVISDDTNVSKAVYSLQDDYPEVSFILPNQSPYNPENGDILLGTNTLAQSFDAGQTGFLAGYMAVKEGYNHLGFLGENQTVENKSLGFGFVKGANYAAREMETEVTVEYAYSKNSADNDVVRKEAEDMFDKHIEENADADESNVEVIFAAGSGIQNAVIEAAEVKDGRVIGSVTNENDKSETVITSVVYNISDATKEALELYKGGKFPGGTIMEYNASNDGIGAEMKNSRFENMNGDDYKDIYEKLADGEVKVRVDKIAGLSELKVTNISIIAH